MQGGEAPGPLFLAGSWLRAWLRACSPRLWGPRGARANVSSAGGRLCPPPLPMGSNPHPFTTSFSPRCTPNWRRGELGLACNPRPAGAKGVVSQSGGCGDLDSSTPPERARRTRSLSLEKLVKPLSNRSLHTPLLSDTVPFLYLRPHPLSSLHVSEPTQPGPRNSKQPSTYPNL